MRQYGFVIQSILNLAARKIPNCGRAAWFNLPLPQNAFKRAFTLDEIGAWLDACQTAIWPPGLGCPPGLWWECLIRFVYNTGLQISMALAFRREWIRRRDGIVWAEIPGTAGDKAGARLLYVSPAALEAVDKLPTGELVFPWPFAAIRFRRLRRTLLGRAGLPAARRFGFEALRGALRRELHQRDPRAAVLHFYHMDQGDCEPRPPDPWQIAQSVAAVVGPVMQEIPQP